MKTRINYLQILFFIIIIFIFSSCNSKSHLSDIDVKKTSEEIISNSIFPSMIDVDIGNIEKYYEMESSNIEDVSLYINASGGFPDELFISKSENKEKADIIHKNIEKRKEILIETFRDYQPDEMYKLEESQISRYGNYNIFIVSENSDEVLKEIKKYFK